MITLFHFSYPREINHKKNNQVKSAILHTYTYEIFLILKAKLICSQTYATCTSVVKIAFKFQEMFIAYWDKVLLSLRYWQIPHCQVHPRTELIKFVRRPKPTFTPNLGPTCKTAKTISPCLNQRCPTVCFPS